ncbi:hypothetical protein V8E54_011508 [Elaphomyces granulatus]
MPKTHGCTLDNSTGNMQEGMVSVASRRNQLALAAALRRQQEQDRVAQKSTAGAGDIGNQVQVGMATPVGDVLTASSSTQHTSVSVPSVVPTTPPRNSGSIFGSPPMLSSVSALPWAAELADLNRRPRLSSTGEAMPPPADKETLAEGLLEGTKAATDESATPTTPIRGRKRPRPPLTPLDANSGLLSIRGDESAPRSDDRRRRKVTLTERAIQSGLYKL